MPQPFNNAVITNEGARLLTRAQAGETKIEFTRIAVGSGSYTEEEKMLSSLQEMAALKSLRNSYPLSNIEIYSDYSVKIRTLITNQNPATKEILVTQGYYINEMGLYAKPAGAEDDLEILYSIVVTSGDNGDFMPPYNGYNPVQIIQDYFVTVNNSAEVTIQSGLGAVALADDLVALQQQASNLQYSMDGLLEIFSEESIKEGFSSVFAEPEEDSSMRETVSTEWNGESSGDTAALKPDETEESAFIN